MDDKTLVERLIEFEKFIRGHDTLDGLWFGDTHPDFKGAFWWRRYSPIEEAADTIEAQATRIEALEAALRRMIYETTHLSPMKPNGDHDCTIKADALQQARQALESQP